MTESLRSICDKGGLSEEMHMFSSSHCGRLKSPWYVPVGLACLTQSILLGVNEIIQGCGAYLRRAPVFLVPKHISAFTNAPVLQIEKFPLRMCAEMLLVRLRSSLETTFYFLNKVFLPDLRRISISFKFLETLRKLIAAGNIYAIL